MRIHLIGLIALAAATGTSAQTSMSPADAVAAAAAAASHGMGKRGTFEFVVRSTGSSHGHVFLNSEPNYRDPQNLSVNLDLRAVGLLTRQLGASPEDFYRGKHIAVRGTARRVPILFTDDYGRSTGKGYFQTHVDVREPAQIAVLSGGR